MFGLLCSCSMEVDHELELCQLLCRQLWGPPGPRRLIGAIAVLRILIFRSFLVRMARLLKMANELRQLYD